MIIALERDRERDIEIERKGRASEKAGLLKGRKLEKKGVGWIRLGFRNCATLIWNEKSV